MQMGVVNRIGDIDIASEIRTWVTVEAVDLEPDIRWVVVDDRGVQGGPAIELPAGTRGRNLGPCGINRSSLESNGDPLRVNLLL